MQRPTPPAPAESDQVLRGAPPAPPATLEPPTQASPLSPPPMPGVKAASPDYDLGISWADDGYEVVLYHEGEHRAA